MSDQSQAMIDLKAIHHALIHGGATDAVFAAHDRLFEAVSAAALSRPCPPSVGREADESLKECPFCGSSATLHSPGEHYVICNRIGVCQGNQGPLKCTYREDAIRVWNRRVTSTDAVRVPPSIDEMAKRFLGWKLPEDFSPDAGVSFKPISYGNVVHWPVGTNLLSADQARRMILHMLAGCNAPAPSPSTTPSTSDAPKQGGEADAVICGRYRVEPTDSGFWSHCVKAGTGTRSLFVGHRKQCDAVAAILQEACLDGAFIQSECTAAPSSPSALQDADLLSQLAFKDRTNARLQSLIEGENKLRADMAARILALKKPDNKDSWHRDFRSKNWNEAIEACSALVSATMLKDGEG